jgi:predicted phage terminase large subunit-like protein
MDSLPFDADDLLGARGGLIERLARTAHDVILPRPEQLDSQTALAERSLPAFVRQAWHTVEPDRPMVEGWVIDCVCAHLEAVTAGQIRNLIINLPPGFMKSLLCCVMWPAWVWVRDPGSRWIFGSYGQGLAFRDSDRQRDLIQSPWYQARWGHVFQFKRSWNTKERFSNNRQGYRIATTVAGKAMGERADYLTYDDPHKPLEVGSRALRESVIRSWTTTMSTRGTDPKTVRKLVIMQRLHERDLSGYLMAEVGGYETLILPMEYEPRRYFTPRGADGSVGPRERDAIRLTSLQRERPELRDGPGGSGRRFDGDLLWPERFGPAEVEALKATLQGPGTAGQLQQRPAAAEGALFKAEDFRHFTVERDADGALWVVLGVGTPERPEPPRLPAAALRYFQVADTALKDTETSAYTCVGTFAWHPPSRTLLAWHVWRGRLEVREQMEALKTLREGEAFWDRASRRWVVPGRLAPWPRPLLYQAVEDKASGIGLLQEARAEGYQLLPLRAVLGKAQRAAGAVTMLRQGRVWFRAAAPWLVDFEEELLTFPNGAWSDQADVLSYACMQAATETLLNAAVEGDLTVWPDPRGPGGRPLDPEDVADWDGHRERLNVGSIEVEFDDDPETAWLDG